MEIVGQDIIKIQMIRNQLYTEVDMVGIDTENTYLKEIMVRM
jgi:hypothetical protein